MSKHIYKLDQREKDRGESSSTASIVGRAGQSLKTYRGRWFACLILCGSVVALSGCEKGENKGLSEGDLPSMRTDPTKTELQDSANRLVVKSAHGSDAGEGSAAVLKVFPERRGPLEAGPLESRRLTTKQVMQTSPMGDAAQLGHEMDNLRVQPNRTPSSNTSSR